MTKKLPILTGFSPEIYYNTRFLEDRGYHGFKIMSIKNVDISSIIDSTKFSFYDKDKYPGKVFIAYLPVLVAPPWYFRIS